MRATKVGTIQDAVARCYRAVGGVEAVAEQLGLANSTVSYGTEVNEARPGGIGVNYLVRLALHDSRCAVPLAEFFADHAGGVFEPVLSQADVISLYARCGLVAKECGEAQAAIIRAAETLKAGHLDEAEREIDEAIAVLVKAKADVRQKRGVA
ncbi:hypothetical protein [Arenibacterium halophilum]|uniref:Phage regulatory protein CII (CP76) n=1 Tax=Arenibacterium halophilum TaxID=2583821 RepID=A0ABY2X9C3_9RHOB|nr:hypothetical protein [Arenibacterium halophilum]TMV11922.1 hypothetical protein FGK64_16855 [Arenibacterium halophilum]